MFSALSELLYLAAKASLVGVYVWWVCCAAIGVGAPNRLTPGNTVEVGGAILIMGLLMLALCAAAVLAAMVVTGLVAIVLAP